MGRNNQRRREDKRRRAARRPHGPDGDGPGGGDVSVLVEMMALAGGAASFAGDRKEREAAAAGLAGLADAGAPVNRVLGGLIAHGLSAAWEGGWQPAELVRQVRRRRRDLAAAVVLAGLASAACWAEARRASMPPWWSAQLDALGVDARRDREGDWLGVALRALPDAMTVALDVLGELLHLPVIEILTPPPSLWRTQPAGGTGNGVPGRAEDPVLAKVRALLAKAESTQFAAEAEALSAKAQELMSRHAIEEALARASGAREERPGVRRLPVDDPYAEAKSLLLSTVASANGVRCVWYGPYAMMAVVGFARDLDAVEVLFTSLLVQASHAMLAKGSVTDRRGRSRTRSFRQSFLVAYADRIGERLAVAAWEAKTAVEGTLARDLTPVLASREAEVDAAVEETFPRLSRHRGPSVTNEDGWRAGRVAAELATLGPRQGRLEGVATA
jgi:hypothetical protein